ncbi:hypothetical protein IVB41_24575 [Bradyrhizobium sp. 44]|uniref:hypothetical protein n=1 Tax=Bradyrhizobium sp. 44 TaxID=2782675 RepID=UPI001FFB1366|nr:hypothetical protein [Bradyrhizobium sp. 44]MCK1287088.1 hypothetical protein [Bradyrhizobium sp. 44]
MVKTKQKHPGHRESALGRLISDGASSSRQISRRLQWLAAEWGIEAPPKVGRTMSEKLTAYCKRHGISFDWMLDGSLAVLKKMVDERRRQEALALPAAVIVARYQQLDPEQKAEVTAEIYRIMAEHDL